LAVARLHPELSPRLLAVKITDEEDFAIAESTVYRILKKNGLIVRMPLYVTILFSCSIPLPA